MRFETFFVTCNRWEESVARGVGPKGVLGQPTLGVVPVEDLERRLDVQAHAVARGVSPKSAALAPQV